ncbi:MAG: C-terminal binding protein [Acidimicrobiia bacterium]|nr:C-terminal binding protein [Acidimicrobiia bacterium]
MAQFTVVAQLPAQGRLGLVEQRYAWELEALRPIGAEIVEVAAATDEEFLAGCSGCDAIITSWGFPITRRLIESLQRCRVIGVGSVGVDMVDIDAATEAGIVVTNTPDIFIEEVADHAMALLLGCARRVTEMHQMVVEGRWFEGRPLLSSYPRLWGSTLGLVSFGNVARAVARRARAFGLHLAAYDPFVSELTMTAEGVEPVTSLAELLERSDHVSVHAPLNRDTYHLIGADALGHMRQGAVLVNTGRGGVVDELALEQALASGHLAAAALDVLEQEPPGPDHPLLQRPNVILSPHVASATSRMRPETRRRVGREVALVLSGRWPRSSVNPTVLPKVALERWQPYPMERGPNR